jgi:uncharacterized membrane protein YvbJ
MARRYQMNKCPYCSGENQEEALVCRHCGRAIAKPDNREILKNHRDETKPKRDNLQLDPNSVLLRQILEEQQKQTDYLKNISSVASIIGLIIIISIGLYLLSMCVGPILGF